MIFSINNHTYNIQYNTSYIIPAGNPIMPGIELYTACCILYIYIYIYTVMSVALSLSLFLVSSLAPGAMVIFYL